MMKTLLILVLFMGYVCEAKPKSSKKRRKSKVVNVNFDDELRIRGKLFGPSIFTLFQKKNLNYGKLIQPRKDFLPEMRETLGDLN